MFKSGKNFLTQTSAYSLVEILVVLLITSVLALAVFPVISKRLIANNIDVNVLKCVITESAGSLTSDACSKVLENSTYEKNSTSNSLIYLANNGKNAAEIAAARRVLAASCDRGGEKACAFMVDSCKKDITNCNISASNDDLNYFLNLSIDANNLSKRNIVKYLSTLYEGNNSIIVSQVNSACCRPTATYACLVKGMTECPLQEYFSTSTFNKGYTYSVTTDYAGNVYSTGKIYNGTNYDAFVIKTDKNGTIVWQKIISSVSSVDDEGRSITIDQNGSIYVGGYIKTNIYDFFLVKLDYSGNTLWKVTMNKDTSGDDDKGFDIVLDSLSHINIVGHTKNTGSLDVLIEQYSTDGVFQWSSGYNSTNNKDDGAKSTAIDSSGNIYITGYSESSSGIIDLLIMKITPGGAVSWSKRFDSTSHSADYGQDITFDPSGYLYITGYSGNNLTVYKADLSGNLLFKKTYSSAGAALKGYGIKVDIDGNIYVTGLYIASGINDTIITKLSNNGDLKWTRKLSTSSANDEANSVTVDRMGQVYIGGYTNITSYDRPVIMRIKKDQVSNCTLSTVSEDYTDTNPNMAAVVTSFAENTSSLNINNASLITSNPYLDFK
jgi:hypothetical protein